MRTDPTFSLTSTLQPPTWLNQLAIESQKCGFQGSVPWDIEQNRARQRVTCTGTWGTRLTLKQCFKWLKKKWGKGEDTGG